MKTPPTLEHLPPEAIPAALEKAAHCRLINEPAQAESICHDVLLVDPDNQRALVILLLALSDRFGHGYAVGLAEARHILPRLRDEYERAYYAGILCDRKAKALLEQVHPGPPSDAYEYLREAIDWYEKAEALSPPGASDALLRRNTCARILAGNPLAPHPDDPIHLQSE